MSSFGKYSITDGMESYVYKKAFGDLPSAYVYKDALNGIKQDMHKDYINKCLEELMLNKAASSSTLTVPTVIDAEVQDHLQREMPVVSLVRRATNQGKVASYNYESAVTDAAFKGENAALADQDDTYTNATANMKYSYAVGGITGVGQAADKHYIDMFSEVLRSKTLRLKELHEQKFLTGDDSVNTLEYDGLNAILTTNTYDKDGAAIQLGFIGTALDASRAYGGVGKKIGITDYTTLRSIKALMMADVHYIDKTNIAWGLETVQYEGMPIVPSRFSTDSSAARRFYIMDSEVTEYRVLQEPVMEDLAKANDSMRFFIKEYSVPICKHEARGAMIYELA